jgi:hypothetical protein
MITRTYLSKFNTIIKDSTLNTGINPVAELMYGTNISRMLIYFDHNKLKRMVENKTFPDLAKFKHYLKITNAGSIDFTQIHHKETSSIDESVKIRATSFDLIFFLVPKEWDNGKGFDYSRTFFNQGYYGQECNDVFSDSARLISTDASNWYQAKNGYYWDEDGIYSNDTLSKEYDNFSSGEGSKIIIGRQHFDIGNENINLDITDIVNRFITGDLTNYGIGIAYSPMLELTKSSVENYVGFLTPKTNTFFEPYLETIYCDYISDDRANFVLNKNNKLYLYSNIGGNPTNLDEIPKCHVNDIEYEVKQYSKGVYYIDINLSQNDFKANTMLFDVWSNIIYNGTKFDDVELDFTLKGSDKWFSFGSTIPHTPSFIPNVYGIKNDEHIKRGDIRKLNIDARVPYTNNQSELVDEVKFRLYVKDGTREIDVIPFMKVNKTFLENYVMIDTSILIPNQYYIDIKFNYNMENIIHHNVLSFNIVDDLNNKYN